MAYPDDYRRHEAFCAKRCDWTARSATPEGARVLAEHHTAKTLQERLHFGYATSPVGHQTDVREVAR